MRYRTPHTLYTISAGRMSSDSHLLEGFQFYLDRARRVQ